MTSDPGARRSGGASELLTALTTVSGPDPILHVQHLAPRPGWTSPWPGWAPHEVVDAFRGRGIERPWRHQVEAAEIAYAGRNVVVSTGTASGKSLAYQLPVLAALTDDPKACALYLSPTKALAADQLESLESLGLRGIRPSSYDGDTPMPDRDWARDHARFILTNPDMVHLGLLPQHARFARVLRRLRFVVIDECHYYRGVFGSHVALVIRRLRRLAQLYGSDPTFVCASATVANPQQAAARLIGAPVSAVTDDSASHPGADFVLWEPPLLPDDEAAHDDEADHDDEPAHDGEAAHDGEGPPLRRSAPAETARILATLVATGARTLAFVRSRAGAERTALTAQHLLSRTAPALVDRVAAYRGGYLPEDRRELENAFDSGELVGVCSTNALELGVDIAGIDAAVLAGYPGTIASMWQQAGRAGRGDRPALAVFVARDDPLDSYLVHHPDAIFGRPVEAAVTNPSNIHVLAPHLACAAAENRLTEADLALFGGDVAREALRTLLASRTLRRRPSGYYFAGHRHPAGTVNLRSSGRQVAIVEADTGRMLGTEDAARACATSHPQAVYLHQGQQYVVDELDLEQSIALVHRDRPDWTTTARTVTNVELVETSATVELPDSLRLATGRVRATEQVVGYLRRRSDGVLIDSVDLDMPEQILDTRGVWYTIPRELLLHHGIQEAQLGGALHAAEHAAIGLLPLLASCDRTDIGGLSTALHPDTGEPTVIVYDGYPGGAGFADRGFEVATDWLTATRDAVAACGCRSGCPSCVQSPKCGNGNHPLDKAGAVIVIGLIVDALATSW